MKVKGKIKRQEAGITLVALVVTIVILLILEGVSINMVIGNNGIVTMAQKAKTQQLAENVKDIISDELASIEIEESQGNTFTEEQKRQRVVETLSLKGFDPATNNKITINNNQTLVIIDKDNVVSIVTGKDAVKGDEGLWDWIGENAASKEVGICGYNGTEETIIIPEYVVENNEVYTVTAVKNCGSIHDKYGIHSKNTSNDHKLKSNTTIKNITMLNNVKKIDGGVFSNNSVLESVTMSDCLQEFTGGSTFFGCKNLKYCKLSKSITKIPDNLFQNCTSLQEINIPEGTTEIGAWAFSGVKSVEKIVIPSSVEKIGEGAFYAMGGDSSCKLKEVIIENGVTDIGEQAFGVARTATVDLHLPQSLNSSNIGTNAFVEFGKYGGAKVYLYDGTILSTSWAN